VDEGTSSSGGPSERAKREIKKKPRNLRRREREWRTLDESVATEIRQEIIVGTEYISDISMSFRDFHMIRQHHK
jgi:hypothetical protein